MGEMLMAQDLLKTEDGYVRGGFNTRLQGGSFRDVAENNPRQPSCHGWNLADEMIDWFCENHPTLKKMVVIRWRLCNVKD